MISWDKETFGKYFEHHDDVTIDKHEHYYTHRGSKLRYDILVREREEDIAVSADTECPFGGQSLYEFYLPCKKILLTTKETVPYREFHFCFYKNDEEVSMENLSLTISCRHSDRELVVWPYYYNPTNQMKTENS